MFVKKCFKCDDWICELYRIIVDKFLGQFKKLYVRYNASIEN